MLEDKSNGFDTSSLLYFLIWGPRTNSKIYYHFLKVEVKIKIYNFMVVHTVYSY